MTVQGVSAQGFSKAPHVNNLDQIIETIKKAHLKGLFKPYEDELNQSKYQLYEEIKKISTDSREKNESSSIEKLIYLLTIAIDPELEEQDKLSLFTEYFISLDKKKREVVVYLISSEKGLILHILKYCSNTILREVCMSILKNRSTNAYEPFFLKWALGITQNNWALIEKQVFLNSLFEILPSGISDDLFFYFFIHMDEKTVENFFKICPQSISERAESLKKEVIAFGEQTLAVSDDFQKCIFCPSYKNNQRKYYLEWVLYFNAAGENCFCDG